MPPTLCLPTEVLLRNTLLPERWQIKAGDPAALTRVLDLADFAVTAVEDDACLDGLRVRCAHLRDVAVCPHWDTLSAQPHQDAPRTVRDRPVTGHPCRLECPSRRFKCAQCRRPCTERLTTVAPPARGTRRYEQQRFAPCRGSTSQAVARRERLGDQTVAGRSSRLAAKQDPATAPGAVRRLGSDESALKTGPGQDARVLADRDRRRLLTVLPERTTAAVAAQLATWSTAARAAVTAMLPQARLTGERCQVMQHLNERVSEARRARQREAPAAEKQPLTGVRWRLVKNQGAWDEAEQAKLAELDVVSPTRGRLHHLKEAVRTSCATAPDRRTAEARLSAWMAEVEARGLPRLPKVVATLRRWWEVSLNSFHDRLTSGFVEGLNTTLKLLKRWAFGSRHFEHFRLRVLVECDGRAGAH